MTKAKSSAKKRAPVKKAVKKRAKPAKKAAVKKARPAAVKTAPQAHAAPAAPQLHKGDEQKVAAIVKALDNKKAEEIRVFNVANQSDMWDYFIVCSGTASVHNRAIRDSLKKEMVAAGYNSLYEDRDYDTHWIVVDYTDILVHIFDRETRLYYSIEKIWGENEEPVEKYLKAGGA